MTDPIKQALSDSEPRTAEWLADRLPGFPVEAVRQALQTLAQQGVLEEIRGTEGATASYRYVAPERYVQANQDVVRDPSRPHNRPAGAPALAAGNGSGDIDVSQQ